jgi:hypothetical protein
MIHTYRIAPEGTSKYWPGNRFPLIGAIALLCSGIIWVVVLALKDILRGSDVSGATFVLGFLLLPVGYVIYEQYAWPTCLEIRLNDDGGCEFETKRRVISASVGEIRSVKEDVDKEYNEVIFRIRLRDGTRLAAVPGREYAADRAFRFFLARVTVMNPAIKIKRPKTGRR